MWVPLVKWNNTALACGGVGSIPTGCNSNGVATRDADGSRRTADDRVP